MYVIIKRKRKETGIKMSSKNTFLFLSVTIDKPETVSVYQVKKTDKDAFKKKASWRFRDLKIIDGKDATKV